MKLLVFLLVITASAAEAANELPIDLAYNMKTMGKEDAPALSHDGKWIVYGVYTPPTKSPGSEMELEPRFLPNGTPGTYAGTKLFLTNTVESQPISICPGKGNCWRPSWSPDDTKVVFYSDADGVPNLWVYELKAQASRKVSSAKIKAKLWMGDEAYWDTKSRIVYVPLAPSEKSPPVTSASSTPSKPANRIRTYFSGKEVKNPEKAQPSQNFMEFFLQENNADLSAIDLESGAVNTIVTSTAEPRPSCLTISPSGKWIAYLSVYRINDFTAAKAFYDLAIAPADGGKVTVIDKDLEVNDNDYYTLAYRWHPSKDQLVYYKNKHVWWVDLNNPEPAPKQLTVESGELAPQPLAFTTDGSRVVIGTKPIDRKDYSGFWPTTLAVIDLNSGKSREIQFPKDFEFDHLFAGISNLAWQSRENEITSIWRDPSSSERVIFHTDLNSGKSVIIHKQIGRIRFIGNAAQAERILATFEDAATPGDIYSFAADFSSRKRISQVEQRFENIKLGSIEFFETELPQYDGKMIHAQTAVVLPPGAKKGDRLPTIVFHYAGDSLARKADRFLAGSPASVPISVFVTRGYAALLTYLIIAPEGAPGNPIQNMVDVLLPQIYHAAELGYIDINRVALLGQSYGGYSTAAIITKTNLFRAAIAISGSYDLPGLYSWMINDITPHMNWSEGGQGRMGGPPWSNLARYIENSPYYQADKINTPLLMVHGGNDDTCPVQDAEKMFVALRRLEKTAQLAVYEGEGHTVDTWSLEKAVDATDRILTFLKTYL